MFCCPLCEEYTLYSVCNDCRKIRHYISIYSKDRVLEILENVLTRSKKEEQDEKIVQEINEEIVEKKKSLRSHKSN